MVGFVIPNPDDGSTTAEGVSEWVISRSELGAYLLLFDRVGYYHGYRVPAVMLRMGEPWKLRLPDDPALNREDNPLVAGFFTSNPHELLTEAMVIQMKFGFSSVPDTTWLYHPKYFVSQAAYKATAGALSPEIGLSFLEGLWCPADDTELDDILDFREKRKAERDAFLDALLRVSEGVFVENHGLAFNVPVEIVERALVELNRTAIERWAVGVRKSFSCGVRVNKASLLKLAAAAGLYETTGNLVPTVLSALWGLVEINLNLTPRVEKRDDLTKAVSFAWDARQRFPNVEQYSRYKLKRP